MFRIVIDCNKVDVGNVFGHVCLFTRTRSPYVTTVCYAIGQSEITWGPHVDIQTCSEPMPIPCSPYPYHMGTTLPSYNLAPVTVQTCSLPINKWVVGFRLKGLLVYFRSSGSRCQPICSILQKNQEFWTAT